MISKTDSQRFLTYGPWCSLPYYNILQLFVNFFTKFQHTKIRFLFLRFYLFFYLLLWKKASSSVIKGFPKGVRAQKFRLCWEAPTVQAVAAQVSGPWFWRCCSAMCVEWSTMSKELKFLSKSRQEYVISKSTQLSTANRSTNPRVFKILSSFHQSEESWE